MIGVPKEGVVVRIIPIRFNPPYSTIYIKLNENGKHVNTCVHNEQLKTQKIKIGSAVEVVCINTDKGTVFVEFK
jgi:uncharacterized OB-fold protein